ncbi:MAG: hypothetical protein HQK96_19395, partial [Nitrospirae bacterium]|nr:hypothetical protein [Nitrospirota bacterium]
MINVKTQKMLLYSAMKTASLRSGSAAAAIIIMLLLSGKAAYSECTKGDCLSGHGTFVFSSGEKYEGEFTGGNPHGTGTVYYPNGDIYTGQLAGGV